MIRTFLSRQNTLTYQAGAGIVAASKPETELQEVNQQIRRFEKGYCVSRKNIIGRIMKILVFDNYDSFTYNLVHLVEKILHDKVDVCPK